MNDGLSVSQREAIRHVFSAHPEVREARLYGSRALSTFREASDIDITLLGDINMELLNRITNELDDLLLPYEFDVSIFEQIDNPLLIEHIKQFGRSFYRLADNDDSNQ